MSENYEKEGGKVEGEVKIKTPFLTWLDNFFYHYKWHTVAVLFVIAVIVICTMQTCSRTTFDTHIMYAGDKDVKMSAPSGETSEHEELLRAVKKYTPDRDGDGNRNIDLKNLYLPSDAEIARLEALIAELKAEGKESFEIGYSLISSNRKTFSETLIFGDCYVYIISDHLLFENTSDPKSNPFAPIKEYLPEGAEYETGNNTESGKYALAGEWGVYLHSTPLSDEPGFSSLPENTVIAMRKLSVATSSLSREKAEAYFAYNEEILRNMLSGEAYS